MKRKVIGGLFAIFVLAMLTSCGEEKKQEPQKSEAEITPTPTVKEEEPTPTPVKEDEERLEIVLPDQSQLVADYSSVSGIQVEKGMHIAMVAKDVSTGFWKAVKSGAKQAVEDLNKELGYTGDDKITMSFEGPKNDSAVDDQINMIDAVLADNPDALCLGIIDMNSCQAQLETARENGIPVIVMDSGNNDVNSEEIQAICATDNVAAGAEAARKLCESIQDNGKIAVLAHEENTRTSRDRVSGFLNEITKNHPQVSVVNTIYANTKDDYEEQVRKLLETNPDLKGVFCTNETTYQKVGEILTEKEGEPLKIVGFDSGEEQIQAVKDGEELGFISQNPYAMGYATVVAAARSMAKQENSPYIDTGFQWIDQNNIESEEMQKYLYQ